MSWKLKIILLVFLGVMPQAICEEQQQKQSWYSADFSIANSVGLGTFFVGPAASPQWTTSFTVAPSVNLPLPSSWPHILVNAELAANVWWLNSLETSAFDTANRIQFEDLAFGFSAPKVYEFPDLGISFSAGVPFIIPISTSSRAFSRVLSLGILTGVSFKKHQFSVSFTPQAKAWIHSGQSKTIACNDLQGERAFDLGLLNPQNVDFEVDQYMMALSFYRDESANGSTCMIAGRQNTWTLKLPLSAAYSLESHKFAIGLSYYWNFLRPLEYRPELSSPNSSSQSFTQTVLGRAAYTYVLPTSFDMALSTGVISYQSVFAKTGSLLFPFFDFVTPVKNQTHVFLEMTASI